VLTKSQKRKRREYRLARKAAFTRPEPGFSMYEGRTRGKKLKYTYSEDEDISSDDQPSSRRSTRNVASTEGPRESRRPRFTASGRQIRSRAGGLYGEALLYGQRDGADDEEFDEEEEVSRPQRTRTSIHPNGYSGYNAEDLDDASEVHSSANDSGNEWRGVEDDLENDFEGNDEEDEEETSAEESVENEEPASLVVQLRYGKGDASSNPEVQIDKPPPMKDVEMKDVGEPAAAPFSVQVPPQTLPHPSSPAVQQPPAMATPSFPSVPIPQVPTQPAPVMAVPSVASASKPQEATPQVPMAAPSMPSSQEALDASARAPKASQSIEPNGVNRS